MGSLAQLCCLAAVVAVSVARPNAEISQRDARGQTIMDETDPFWIFQTPGKPIVYMPNYDAILVPEREIHQDTFPVIQSLAGALPFQSARRRRPILALIDLLQKRYSHHSSAGNVEGSTEKGVTEGQEKEDSEISKKSSKPLVSHAADEPAKIESDLCQEGSYPKPDANLSESKIESTNDTVGSEEIKVTNPVQSYKESTPNPPQISRVYSLLDTLIKDHPDLSEGFSYAYKYAIPNTRSKLDEVEVSVQQSLKRFPGIPEEPLQQKLMKAPIDYKKAQEKLDSILEDSTRSGGAVHLNTPGAFGPLLLSHHMENNPEEKKNPSAEDLALEVPEGRRASNQKPTKLVLRPVAKAVAGPRGIAVASPIAKAVLRRGQRVTLDYDPDAVAIAGPGGRAHAHPEFSVDYLESKESQK